ncbi:MULTISPECIES: DUF3039 domain-containing protein [Brachybacterium]|uniref:DUF3039 domain-containing protein n=1 Tax=Brachybacterium alimentarium TaxID=47845 RepID=A0A2A3YJI9_9MICO|nr:MULTISPECIES: DUF3039 domain-containing protein [Brachybacterium]PCC35737.1 hypothetical protein CIK71_02070 [Brachybacterium alimentarium]PCC39265.1 hypothetical protein CIK66_10360 [Brachybacterium alimentarium]RCS63703.1 DUF3039 domain-containing protein [Brachybacterium alimentarium]RCS64342.1 DUF3039 domain-containing protein [Brachybacterium sp. JB7]RCS67885.1 DUF3039 domain-containing protein [Brachybacterium alimentarium]
MSSTSDPSRMDPYSDDPGAAPGSTAVLDRQLQEQEQSTDDGDHDRYAHYVRKDKITQAALGGTPVIALCGKVWVPGRDPEKYPVCPECKEIYQGLREPQDGDGGKGGGSGRGGGFRGFFGGRR